LPVFCWTSYCTWFRLHTTFRDYWRCLHRAAARAPSIAHGRRSPGATDACLTALPSSPVSFPVFLFPSRYLPTCLPLGQTLPLTWRPSTTSPPPSTYFCDLHSGPKWMGMTCLKEERGGREGYATIFCPCLSHVCSASHILLCCLSGIPSSKAWPSCDMMAHAAATLIFKNERICYVAIN